MLENKIKIQHRQHPDIKLEWNIFFLLQRNGFLAGTLHWIHQEWLMASMQSWHIFKGIHCKAGLKNSIEIGDIFTFQFAFPAAICFWSWGFFPSKLQAGFSESEHQSRFHRKGDKGHFFRFPYPSPSSSQEFLASRHKLRVIPSLCWIKVLAEP